MIDPATTGRLQSLGADAQLNSDTPALEKTPRISLPSANLGGNSSSQSYMRLGRLSLLWCCAWAFIRLHWCASCSLLEPAGILGAVQSEEFASMLNTEETFTDKDMCKCLSAQELRGQVLISPFLFCCHLLLEIHHEASWAWFSPKPQESSWEPVVDILRALTSDAGLCLLSTKDFLWHGWESIKFCSLPQLPICRTEKTVPFCLWRKTTLLRMYSQPFSQEWEIFPSQQEHCFPSGLEC